MRNNLPKKMITKDLLIKFCKENNIFYHKGATLNYLQAAIYRFTTSKSSSKSCFGFWDESDGECSMCSHEEKCFKLSIGEDRKKYEREVEKVVNEDEWI